MLADHYHLPVQDSPLPQGSHNIGAEGGLGSPGGDPDGIGQLDVLFLGSVVNVGEGRFGGAVSEFRLSGDGDFGQESNRFGSGHAQNIDAGQEEHIAYK